MKTELNLKKALALTASATVLGLAAVAPAHALPIRDDIGVDGAVDTDNVWGGVGMMWNRTPFGTFVCTGQLVNPRTVVWAAHCVDGFNAASYGGNQAGGIPIGFGFQVDSLPGYFDWRDRGLATGEWSSNADLSFFNVLQVQAPFGLDGEFEFPGGDVALATLDAPAIGLPTYGMLFSPITEDTPVSMVGYGGTGIGSGVNVGIDGKRRAGTNMLNGLFSQHDFLGAAFALDIGSPFGPSGDQLLYHVDFDRPDRDASDCYRAGPSGNPGFFGPDDILCDTPPFSGGVTWDFNQVIFTNNQIDWYPGEATEREAGTLGGDSGSGLFVEAGGQQLVTGVLSGGWVPGLFSPAQTLYADVSYYQPLFMYQNWIVEQMPYVYATAAEGDGVWSDASRWTRGMDPSFFYIDENGDLVNGIVADAPETPADALAAEGPVFGTIFDTTVEGYREGDFFDNSPDYSAGDDPVTSGAQAAPAATSTGRADGVVQFSMSGGQYYGPAGMPMATQIDENSMEAGASPVTPSSNVGVWNDGAAAQVDGDASSTGDALGLAPQAAETDPPTSGFGIGATDFVPNNAYGMFGDFTGALSGDVARFYDVTLANAGTTTVDMNVEIDRLRITGADAGFVLPEEYMFSTLISMDQSAGVSTIDGLLMAREVMMTGGLLHGSGTISTLTLWNVAGMVSPGDLGALGQLDILGDYVQTTAGALMFDWGPEGSDLLTIDGDVALDGVAGIMPVDGYMPRFGDSRTVLTYTGDLSGALDGFANLPGALTLTANYLAGAVELQIDAVPYADVVNFTTPAQEELAELLTLARDGNYDALSDIYGVLDLLSGEALINALENLAPHEHFQLRQATTSHQSMFTRSMFDVAFGGGSSSGGGAGGAAMFTAQMMGSDSRLDLDKASLALATQQAADGPQMHETGAFRIYGEVGSIDGEFATTAVSTGGDLEGEFGFVGGDYAFNHWLRVGASLGYADSTTDQVLAGGGSARSDVETIELAAYALATKGNLTGLARIARADHSSDQSRVASVGGVLLPVNGGQDGETLEATLGGSYAITLQDAFVLTPYASVTWRETEFDAGPQTGSAAALNLQSSLDNELIGRLGLNVSNTFTVGGTELTPSGYIGFAGDRLDNQDQTAFAFAAAPGLAQAAPGITATGRGWTEAGASLSAELRDGFAVSVNYDITSGRKDALDIELFSIGARLEF